jgi:hypothetical protein
MILTCKQASKALAEGDYKDLPKSQQLMLRFHVAVCFICHGFNRNIMRFQDLVRAFRVKEDTLDAGPSLSAEARERIRKAIEKQNRAS